MIDLQGGNEYALHALYRQSRYIFFFFKKEKKHTLLILLSRREENRLHLKRDYKYIYILTREKDDRVIRNRICIIYEDLGFQILKY